MEDLEQLAQLSPESEPKTIPLFLTPAAAGYASPTFGQDYEDYELKPDDPAGAVFAVRLKGDSMEPHFKDGSIVFCNKDPLRDGDIGIFYVGDGTVCKQYHRRGGITYLFSLNRDRSDADVVVTENSSQPFAVHGRVLTNRRYQIPGEL